MSYGTYGGMMELWAVERGGEENRGEGSTAAEDTRDNIYAACGKKNCARKILCVYWNIDFNLPRPVKVIFSAPRLFWTSVGDALTCCRPGLSQGRFYAPNRLITCV
jgi:hypothetical protein